MSGLGRASKQAKHFQLKQRSEKQLQTTVDSKNPYCNPNYFWWIINVTEGTLFICSDGKQEGDYLRRRSLPPFFGYFSVWKDKKMRVWLGTGTPGQKGQTRGPPLTCEEDVRDEVKNTSSCFFTDLWRLNGNRGRGVQWCSGGGHTKIYYNRYHFKIYINLIFINLYLFMCTN